MDKYRSMSCREGRIKMESFNSNSNSNNGGNGDLHSKAASSSFPSNMQDLRSFSTSYASNTAATNSSYYAQNPNNQSNGDQKRSSSSSSSSSSCSRGGVWGLGDPELQRKKRVASYKVYAVEGKMKGSLRKSFRWIKNTCSQVVYAWR